MSYTLPDFLAHAIALEREAEERYGELAATMDAHNNPETARVFRDMARFSKMHGDAVAERAIDLPVSKLASWEFRWQLPPEVGEDEGLHYLMTPYHALKYARDNEIRGMAYYSEVAASSEDPEVQRLGAEFANEEKQHIDALERWIAIAPRPSTDWMEDPDPAQGQG